MRRCPVSPTLFLRNCRVAALNKPSGFDWPDCDKEALLAALEMKLAAMQWENKQVQQELQSTIDRMIATKRLTPEQVEKLLIENGAKRTESSA